MECSKHPKNGPCSSTVYVQSSRGELQLDEGGSRALRLDVAASLSRAPAVGASVAMVPKFPLQLSINASGPVHPFMNTMDEISYWVFTKRAPCLMNYDNAIKKQKEEAQSSKTKPRSDTSVAEVPSPKKKKKRKLSLLDDESGSSEKQQNLYFDTSQTKKQTVLSSCKSDTLRSDIDFNIKIPSIKTKRSRSKLQKNSRTTLHKKNKLVTSTPKPAQLRRSLRQAQQNNNSSTQINSSFEIFNNSVFNGDSHKHSVKERKKSPEGKGDKCTELLAGGDQSADGKKLATDNKLNNSKNEVPNGQFEDLSDVSGFTANYIRSTKLQSTKTSRKLRCKNSRQLMKESGHSVQKDSTLIVCVNKSMNTNPKGVHDCSTESVNVINLVTTNSTEKASRVNKTTSLLKFMDLKTSKDSVNNKSSGVRTKEKVNKNVSFQSRSSSSRYPKRYRNKSSAQPEETPEPAKKTVQPDKKRKISKNSSEFNNSDRKENPEDITVSRTRSGRNIGLTLRQPENSVLVLSNCTEQVSSMVSMNVASAGGEQSEQKEKRVTRYQRSKTVNDKHRSLQRDSIRDKSGFTACFSDSDDDSEPLKQRKFFCT